MTAQWPERIFIDGKGYSMFSEPLNSYLSSLGLLYKLESFNTSCQRGYFGTWEIIDDKLFLIRFVGYLTPTKKLLWKELFPGQKQVFAEWYSGTLHIPWGEMKEYMHHGYASKYEKYLLIDIKKGCVTNRRFVDEPEVHS